MNLEAGREKNGSFVISLESGSKQENEVENKWWHINKEMVRYKLHFFFLTGGVGVISPFTPTFAQTHLNLSATSFAAAVLATQIAQTLTKPLIGFIVDYFNKLKTVLCLLTIGQVIFFFAIYSLTASTSNNIAGEKDNNTFDSCDMCVKYKYPTFAISENNVQADDSVLCKDVIDQTYNLSAGTCYLNANVSKSMELSRYPVKDTDINRTSLLNMSRYSVCLNDPNISHALNVPGCTLCCDNSSSCYSSFDASESVPSDFKSYRFWLFASAYACQYASTSSLLVLSDTACCESVQKSGTDYGRQRLFGPLGWGLMSCVGGLLNYYTQNYMAACALLAAMSAVTLWNISRMDFEKPHSSKTFFKDVGTTFRSRDFVAFAAGALLNGIGMGAIWFYLVWFLTTIGGNDVLSGLVHSVQNFLGELPFMFFAGWMIRRMGHFHLTTLSLFSYCIRFLYLSYLRNPWYVLLIEWTHGIYYGVYYVTMVAFAKMNAKPGTEATMQGVLFMTFDGLGTAIGNVVTGISIDYFGGHQTFYYAGIFFGCFTLISFVYTQFCREDIKELQSQENKLHLET